MHLPHFLDLVKIDNKTSFIGVVLLDALSTEYGQMIRTIKVLNSLIMLLTQQAFDTILIFKIYVTQNMIAFDYFV